MENNFDDFTKEKIWRKYFGVSSKGIDAFGRIVYKDNFECSHIYPASRGGHSTIDNAIPLHPTSNAEKFDNFNGIANGKFYKIKGTKKRGILKVEGEIKSK